MVYREIARFPYVLFQGMLIMIGLYGIFMKLGYRSKLAFVPFINLAKLGEIIDMPAIGTLTAFFGIIDFGLTRIRFYAPNDDWLYIFGAVNLAVDILLAVFRTLLLNGLRKAFDKGFGWTILFFFFPGLTLAYWGSSKRIQA